MEAWKEVEKELGDDIGGSSPTEINAILLVRILQELRILNDRGV